MSTRRNLRSSVAPLVIALLLGVTATACSGDDGASGNGATPALGSGEVPGGFTGYTRDRVSIQAPDGFEQVDADAPDGRTELQVRSEPGPEGLRAAAVVLVVDEPESGAEAESENLAEVVREVNGAEDVEREQVSWNGTDAWVVRWEGPATTGSDVIVRSHSLVADLADGGLVTATVQAPPDLFEEYQLDQALPTVQVEGRPS